jgi:hypothetical protein
MLGNRVNPNGLCHRCAGQAVAATQPALQRQANPIQAWKRYQEVSSGRRGGRKPEYSVREWLCGLCDLHGQQARPENSSRGCHIQPRDRVDGDMLSADGCGPCGRVLAQFVSDWRPSGSVRRWPPAHSFATSPGWAAPRPLPAGEGFFLRVLDRASFPGRTLMAGVRHGGSGYWADPGARPGGSGCCALP